jgi:hypothetical protein
MAEERWSIDANQRSVAPSSLYCTVTLNGTVWLVVPEVNVTLTE